MEQTLPSLWHMLSWTLENTATAVYGAFILWALTKLRRLVGWLINHGPTEFKRWRRRKMRAFLLKFREYEYAPALLHFEINRSGVYMSLFWVAALLWLPLSVIILTLVPETRAWPNLTLLACTPPIYFFEVLWLLKSIDVNEVLKRKRRLAERQIKKSKGKAIAKSALLTVLLPQG
ncbi:hypothetical protein [Pseudomonas sp. PDM19]|uniref:hypothetical protein n=1 Tax=Pseudomonas sp. PDM19 TaxID=2769272 RepID=UPI001780BB7A|nr:hypothetical protein [Pseudomonas sp. PDM19]MBD9632885.1 hypothetical protein [Pseudomonas sp. PDM19]